METYDIIKNRYKILFLYSETLLNIYIRDIGLKGKNKINFMNIDLALDESLRKYFTNFSDLINQIKEGKIMIKINCDTNPIFFNAKNYEFQLIEDKMNGKKIILSRIIYIFNVEYYLTKGANYEIINKKPFFSYLKSNYFNLEDILRLIEKEKISCHYKVDDIKYYDRDEKLFKKIKDDENIYFEEKLILQFHIKKLKNVFITNIKGIQTYYNKAIKKIYKNLTNYSDIVHKYDLIYLYASPIIKDCQYTESKSPISYKEEIRIILDLMTMKNKKYKCKFECTDVNVLKHILTNNKTKILHISAHGYFNGKYSLNLENLKNGQNQIINIDELEEILKLNKKNISKMDLVIILTCYSEDFSDLFLKYGAKNIIYINRKTEIIDRIR